MIYGFRGLGVLGVLGFGGLGVYGLGFGVGGVNPYIRALTQEIRHPTSTFIPAFEGPDCP